MYDMLAAPPELGSPMEAVCMLVLNYRMEQQVFSLLCLLSEEGSSQRNEAFTDAKHMIMPHVAKSNEENKARMIEGLNRFVSRGPIKLRPLSSLELGGGTDG